jgi:hypothetical protein
MLEYAKKHEQKLKELYWSIAFDFHYQYRMGSPHRDDFELPKDTYSQNDFVSIWQGEIIGHINYSINRSANCIDNLTCVHFGSDSSYTFAKDLIAAIKEIFEKYRFNKLCFCVVVGNPVEKTYDKLVKKHGGRIVGIWIQDKMLMDGSLHDVKCYEILAVDYFKSQ